MVRKFLQKTSLIALTATLAIATLLPMRSQAAVDNWQQGASIYPHSVDAVSSAAGLASIDQLAASGASYASIVIPYYQSNLQSHDLHAGPDTPSDAALRQAIAHANTLGMRVMLKPHLEPATGEWRAHIQPANRAAWFQAYGDMLVHYATLGEAVGADQMTVGSELVSLSSPRVNPDNTARWQTLIARVRGAFSGTLTYSAQRPGPMGELETIEFWPQLDYIGSSAYFPLGVDGEPTVQKLQDAWSYWEQRDIRPVHERYNKPVLITEVGYRSLTSSYEDPWNYQRSGAPNEAHQAMAYEAFMGFWNEVDYMQGVYLWDWETSPEAGGLGTTSYTPQNKEAYDVLTRWWDGTGQVTPAPAAPVDSSLAPAPVTTPAPTPTAALPAPAPAAQGEHIQVWWPTREATLHRVQPFKAVIPGRALDQYDLYWRVDGGNLNWMSSAPGDYGHKAATVDVSSWNWNSGDTFTIEFVAYDKAGAEITTTTVPVRVTR